MKKILEIIYRILLFIVVILWVGLIIVEYRNYKKGEKMLAPIKEVVKEYDDGDVVIDYGLGYKSITYNRKTISGKQFGHLFIRERNAAPNK